MPWSRVQVRKASISTLRGEVGVPGAFSPRGEASVASASDPAAGRAPRPSRARHGGEGVDDDAHAPRCRRHGAVRREVGTGTDAGLEDQPVGVGMTQGPRPGAVQHRVQAIVCGPDSAAAISIRKSASSS